MTEPTPSPPPLRRRRHLALSLRALMAVILVVGGLLGWVTHLARIRHNAVEAITRAGGKVLYDWQYVDGKPIRNGQPRGPRWLRAHVGPEYLEDVTVVIFRGPQSDDALLAHVGNLDRLENLDVLIAPGGSKPTSLTDAGLAHLKGLTNLRELNLFFPRASGTSLAFFGGLTRLEMLTLMVSPIGDADLAHIRGLERLEILRILAKRPDPRDPTKSLPEDPAAPHITDVGMIHLKGLTKLRSVVLDHTWITSEGLAVFRDKSRLAGLNIQDNRIDDLAPLGHLTGLRDLIITKAPVASLEPIRHLTQLIMLGLDSTLIDDAGLAGVEDFTAMKRLYLGQTKVTDASLARIGHLKSLESLDISGISLTDAGLAQLAGLPKSNWLNLDDTAVTDAGLAHLAGVPTLKRLSARETKITPAGIAALRKSIPSINVTH